MSLYHQQREKADAVLFEKTGKHWNELEATEWYDANKYRLFLDTYCES